MDDDDHDDGDDDDEYGHENENIDKQPPTITSRMIKMKTTLLLSFKRL